VLDRRQERTERRREHITELNKRAAEADLRLKRLYDAIETGVADLVDPGLKERIAGLKAIRDQAQADTMRARAILDSAAQQPITTTVLRKFAATARKRMRIEGGGYRCDHLRALAQRSRSPTARSASWGQKAICSERSPRFRAQNRLPAAFAVLF
jgi:site-specific DNA recombinase